jgi:hypothetical protein
MLYIIGGIAAETFSVGGAGGAIVQLLLIAGFGTLASYIVSALGQGQISSMVKLVTVFSCIGLIINVIWQAISAVANAFGVKL